MNKYVFGPVSSRRLGRSLGVDLVPLKTCSYDCIYCQLPRTTCKTMQRREWVPVDEVWGELEQNLTADADYITFSGSGEPTLHTGIGTLIERIKNASTTPVAVLTNGSLLWRPEVREALSAADLVIPSLDAPNAESFHAINRPCRELDFDVMVGGLVAFRREFQGAYWLEVFLAGDVNDTDDDIEALASLIRRIQPDLVQLNTVVRPPADPDTGTVPEARLRAAAERIGGPVEVIAGFTGASRGSRGCAGADEIMSMVSRRPCTVEDIAAGLNIHPNEALKHLGGLLRRGTVSVQHRDGRRYYLPAGTER